MATRFPPRYLPTLTEVVNPEVREALERSAVHNPPIAQPVQPDQPPPIEQPADIVLPDRDSLALQVIELIAPQLEAELRSVAQELFEAQYNAMLPSLHLQIEEAVREAIDLALNDSSNRNLGPR
jgi:hypothetical protein